MMTFISIVYIVYSPVLVKLSDGFLEFDSNLNEVPHSLTRFVSLANGSSILQC